MAWYNSSGWNYRKAITINNNSGGSLTDYQVKVTVTFVATKMNADFSDIRFAYDNGTDIPYWTESQTPSSTATVWIKVNLPNIGASPTGDNIVYMYYGKPSATTASNGTNVFMLFNISNVAALYHMDEASWNGTLGEVKDVTGNHNLTAANGANTISDGFQGRAGHIYGYQTCVIGNDSSQFLNSPGTTISVRYRNTSTLPGHAPLVTKQQYARGGLDSYIDGSTIANNYYVPYGWHSLSATGLTWIANRWYTITYSTGSAGMKIYRDGILLTSNGDTTAFSEYGNGLLTIGNSSLSYGYTANGDYDEAIIILSQLSDADVLKLHNGYTDKIGSYYSTRKYAAPAPTVSAIGSEQTPPNITTTNMTITPNENPCRTGICTVTVVIRWSNSGGSDGTVTPNIKIDTVSQVAHATRTVIAGSYIDETFTLSGLSTGTHNICPDPN